jgi:hypothetical protein
VGLTELFDGSRGIEEVVKAKQAGIMHTVRSVPLQLLLISMEGDVDRMIRDLVCHLLSSHGPANRDDAGLSATVP